MDLEMVESDSMQQMKEADRKLAANSYTLQCSFGFFDSSAAEFWRMLNKMLHLGTFRHSLVPHMEEELIGFYWGEKIGISRSDWIWVEFGQ